MTRDSELTRPLAEEGSKIALQYLKGDIDGTEKVKWAFLAIGHHVRMKATEANDDTNRLGLIKMIYDDPKTREIYIKKSMPHMMIDKK